MGMAQQARMDAYAVHELREAEWQRGQARITEALSHYLALEAEISALHHRFIADLTADLAAIEQELS